MGKKLFFLVFYGFWGILGLGLFGLGEIYDGIIL